MSEDQWNVILSDSCERDHKDPSDITTEEVS